MRQQGVELVVRQARDDLAGERDRVDEVLAGQRRAVLALVLDDASLGSGVPGHQQVRACGGLDSHQGAGHGKRFLANLSIAVAQRSGMSSVRCTKQRSRPLP